MDDTYLIIHFFIFKPFRIFEEFIIKTLKYEIPTNIPYFFAV